MNKMLAGLCAGVGVICMAQAPEPLGPLPSNRVLAWHGLERYAFIHFGPNTFTGREWGLGRESESLFNPTALDCRQWARVAREAGLRGIVLTAKHHDGFCLWPSATTTHTVARSPWKDGKGDLVKDLSEACRAEGLKFGVYISPWDRNHPAYGTPAYNDVFVKALEELLGNYGELFEVWFDGAFGEGPNGVRQEYDWPRFVATVRRLQPGAVIFGDAQDVRWVGNEDGVAPETQWALLRREEFEPGTPRYGELGQGHADGTAYVPPEVDVSIRRGWFWKAGEDDSVKSAEELEEVFYTSVGRGANLILNLAPDRRGLIPDAEIASLRAWNRNLQATFRVDLARGARAVADGQRPGYGADRVVDGNPETFWAAPRGCRTGVLTFRPARPVTFDRIGLGEPVRLGQRIARFKVEAEIDGAWTSVGEGTTIGVRRYLRVPPVTASALRLRILEARGCPLVSRFSLYASPGLAREQALRRDREARLEAWRQARLGMFIHWGLYALPAGTWKGQTPGGPSEWLPSQARIPAREWEGLKDHFNPTAFDPRAWARAAKAAGMGYVVFTAKHHDGFCLWDSALTDFKVTRTPFGRDVLKEVVEAFRAEGLRIGIYYSILDWHHPDYLPRPAWETGDAAPGPMRADQAPGQADLQRAAPPRGDFGRYVAYLKGQLKELLTGYGPVDVLWFDGEWDPTWTHARAVDLEAYVRSLRPGLILNNRLDKGRQGMGGFNASPMFLGDFATPEQEVPLNGPFRTDWEACLTLNGSWGWHASDGAWKASATLVETLADTASKGGNLLLNVSPDGTGVLRAPYLERLGALGTWMATNGEAVRGTSASPLGEAVPWGRVTRKGKDLYLHVFGGDARRIVLPVAPGSIRRARLLVGGTPLVLEPQEGATALLLPRAAHREPVRVVRVETK